MFLSWKLTITYLYFEVELDLKLTFAVCQNKTALFKFLNKCFRKTPLLQNVFNYTEGGATWWRPPSPGPTSTPGFRPSMGAPTKSWKSWLQDQLSSPNKFAQKCRFLLYSHFQTKKSVPDPNVYDAWRWDSKNPFKRNSVGQVLIVDNWHNHLYVVASLNLFLWQKWPNQHSTQSKNSEKNCVKISFQEVSAKCWKLTSELWLPSSLRNGLKLRKFRALLWIC